jgi:hypothetical protein
MSLLKVNNLQDLGSDPVVTNGVLAKSSFPTGSILQVVSLTKTDLFSAAANATFATVTGLIPSITPSSTSSKVLVLLDINVVNAQDSAFEMRLRRNSTEIFNSQTGVAGVGIYSANFASGPTVGTNAMMPVGIHVLDSPNTISPVTYDIRVRGTGGTIYVNRSDGTNYGGISTITLMEVAG